MPSNPARHPLAPGGRESRPAVAVPTNNAAITPHVESRYREEVCGPRQREGLPEVRVEVLPPGKHERLSSGREILTPQVEDSLLNLPPES